jgi:hypothetical protein
LKIQAKYKGAMMSASVSEVMQVFVSGTRSRVSNMFKAEFSCLDAALADTFVRSLELVQIFRSSGGISARQPCARQDNANLGGILPSM